MALQYKQCKYCGTIFQSTGGNECPRCMKDREEKFTIIKEYLYKNQGASVAEISNETGIEEKLILHFLRDGRLEMVVADGSLACEKCGAPIKSGRLCRKCSESLSRALGSVLPKQSKPAPQKKAPYGLKSDRSDGLHVDISKRK